MTVLAHAQLAAGSTRAFMARILADDGTTPLKQADISAIAYTISEVNAGALDAITSHSAVALVKTAVIFDTLQKTAPWTVDATGYNFRFSPDISLAAAFPTWGALYLLEVTVTRAVGDPIKFAWRVRTPDVN